MRDTIKRLKRQATDWEKISVKHNKGHASNIYEELFNSLIQSLLLPVFSPMGKRFEQTY